MNKYKKFNLKITEIDLLEWFLFIFTSLKLLRINKIIKKLFNNYNKVIKDKEKYYNYL